MNALLYWFVGLVAGGIIGHAQAHHEVATECQRLGAFYVGDKIFECKERNPGGHP